jgi:hypothetical protein
MAFDVTQSVAELQASFTQWLAGIFGDEGKALAFAQDPYGEFEDAGFTNQNLANLNVQQAVAQACEAPGVPPYVKENLSGYSGPGYAGPPTIEHVVEQVQQVTQIVYQDNDIINTEIQNNSTNVNVGDNFSGEIDVDNVNNSGDENAINTGDDFSGQQNSGDNAVQNTGTIEGGVVAGNNDGINTGAGSNVENAVTGTGNTVGVQTGDNTVFEDDIAQNFGSGNVVQANNSTIENSALAGDDAFNQGGNTVGEGGALSGTGAATGNFNQDNSVEDNDTTTTTTTNTTTNTDSFNNDNDVDNSTETNTNTVTNSDNVTTEQGDGDQQDGDDSSSEDFAAI